MIDFRDAMEQRAMRITDNFPDRIVRIEEYTNDAQNWGILTVMDGDRNIRHFEFFETEDSWRRPKARDDYDIGVRHGYNVYVIVPDGVYREFMDTVGSVNSRFTTSTYNRCVTPPRIMA